MAETTREVIARLWGMGCSQGVIAAKLGKTRSAIAGLLGRMKLRNRRPTVPGGWPGHGNLQRLRPSPIRTPEPIVMPKTPPIPITELGPLSRVDGEPDHCRYIVEGDGADALYCGSPRTTESADCQYCDEHAARCFNNWPPTGRQYRPKDATLREFR